MSPTRTGCLKTNSLTATVAMRPLMMRAGITEPARSTCAITQPPKMSPLPLVSDGIGITLSTRSLSVGGWSGPSGWALDFVDMGTISPRLPGLSPMRRAAEAAPPSPLPNSPAPGVAPARGADWATLKRLLPYLLQYKWRAAAALAFMVGAKVANVG